MKARIFAKYGAMAFGVWTVANIAIGLAWGIPVGLAILAAQ